MQALQHAVLALHVVGARREWAQGRAAQNALPAAGLEQIRQVGMPGRELLHVEPMCLEAALAQEGRQWAYVEALGGSNGDGVEHGSYQLSAVSHQLSAAWPAPTR